MWEAFWRKTKLILGDETLRARVLFVLGAFIVFRLLAAIPIPGIDALALENYLNNNQFLGLLNLFSGGGFSTLSIMMIGVSPFITASIIMQLMTVLSPKLKALYQEEGDAGRQRFTQYSRYLTVPLAFIQAFGFFVLLQQNGVIPPLDPLHTLTNVFVIAAGALLLTWIGELISEFGVGNGVSLLIFALSFLLFPQMIATFLSKSSIAALSIPASAVEGALANQWVYGGLYFLLVFIFTYFYTAITFDPQQISKNLQKNGAFIPGVRPGGTTSEYLGNIITRITLVGALFLGLLAILPLIMQAFTGITALTIGGTALLIVVSVVLDVVKKIDAQTSIREY